MSTEADDIMDYWNSLIEHAAQIAQSGYNIDKAIAILSEALDILKAATHKGV